MVETWDKTKDRMPTEKHFSGFIVKNLFQGGICFQNWSKQNLLSWYFIVVCFYIFIIAICMSQNQTYTTNIFKKSTRFAGPASFDKEYQTVYYQ